MSANNEEWVFTFGHGHLFGGKCVRLQGSFEDTRNRMFNLFGNKWGFQYSAEEWEHMKNDKDRMYPLETEISLEDALQLLVGGE